MSAWLHTAVAVKIRVHDSELVALVPADTCCSVELVVERIFAERMISVEPAVELAAERLTAEMLAAEHLHKHSVAVAVQTSCYHPD